MQQFEKYEKLFGFLFNISKLKSLTNNQLLQQRIDLDKALTHGDNHDLDGTELYEELKIFRLMVPDNFRTVDTLRFALQSQGFYNTVIALRITLTIAITVASAERSFSILKRIKTNLRSTMTQERLSDLALISIEKEIS